MSKAMSSPPAAASSTSSMQRRAESSPLRGTRSETCSRTPSAPPCAAPPRPRRPRPRRAAACVLRRSRAAGRTPRTSRRARPRRLHARPRTRDRSSSPRRPARPSRRAGHRMLLARPVAGWSSRPTTDSLELALRHEAHHVDRRGRLLQPLEVACGRRPGERAPRRSDRRSTWARAPCRGAGSSRSRSCRRPRA